MTRWNAEKYAGNADLFSRSIEDLVRAVPLNDPRTVTDLGCGPGTSMESAAERWPRAVFTGVDIAPEMLDLGRRRHPEWRWVQASVEEYRPAETSDVVLSCATLQWLPDHATLLPRLWQLVGDGGVLGVQVPANQDSPLHRSLFATARSARWREHTANGQSALNFVPPADYLRILRSFAPRYDVWETVYYHELPSLDALIQWAVITVMRPFLARLEPSRHPAFIDDVRAACAPAYPPGAEGRVIYSQKRLFFVACKTPAA